MPLTLRQIERTLTDAGIDPGDAAYEARSLAARYTGLSDARLRIMRDDPLPASDGLSDAVRKRAERFPLQYILGEWEFMGLTFEVGPDCLIPRADTETLVEEALRRLPKGCRAADLCTGSGCIGIAVAHYRPDVTVTAVEISEAAARIAERNARSLGVSDRFTVLRGDVTKEDCFPAGTRFGAVLANPPYISSEEMKALAPELAFEPRLALTDEGDGLSVLRGVLETASRTLTAGGILLTEIGSGQGSDACEMARALPFREIRVLKDLAGRDRVLSAVRAEDR